MEVPQGYIGHFTRLFLPVPGYKWNCVSSINHLDYILHVLFLEFKLFSQPQYYIHIKPTFPSFLLLKALLLKGLVFQIFVDEVVDVAFHYPAYIPNLSICPVVLDHAVGMEYVGPDL